MLSYTVTPSIIQAIEDAAYDQLGIINFSVWEFAAENGYETYDPNTGDWDITRQNLAEICFDLGIEFDVEGY